MMSIDGIKKPKGRPPIRSTAINLRVAPEMLSALDEWRREQPDLPNRPEAIRRLLAGALQQSSN